MFHNHETTFVKRKKIEMEYLVIFYNYFLRIATINYSVDIQEFIKASEEFLSFQVAYYFNAINYEIIKLLLSMIVTDGTK